MKTCIVCGSKNVIQLCYRKYPDKITNLIEGDPRCEDHKCTDDDLKKDSCIYNHIKKL